MGYQDIFKEGNEAVTERYELASGRIREIETDPGVSGFCRDYFGKTAEFLCFLEGILCRALDGELNNRTLSECEA